MCFTNFKRQLWCWVVGVLECFSILRRKFGQPRKNCKCLSKISYDRDEECKMIEGKFYELYKNNDFFWFMRLRVSEVKEGDRNIFYFYYKDNQYKRKNYINRIFNGIGEWKDEEKYIVDTVTEFYGIFLLQCNYNECNQFQMGWIAVFFQD